LTIESAIDTNKIHTNVNLTWNTKNASIASLLPWTRIVVLAVEVFFVLFSTVNGQDNKDKALELLVGGINESVTCVGGGAMARDVKITRNEFGVEIAVTPEWSSFGLKKKVSEILQIEHPNFRSAVSVDFRNKSVVRISPTSCSDVRLISGGQRFVLIKDQWIGELGVRGVSTKGATFTVRIVERVSMSLGEIIELSCEDAEIQTCQRIEVFELQKPEIVLSRIVVSHSKPVEVLVK